MITPSLRFYCVICGTALTVGADSTDEATECPSCLSVVPLPKRTGLSGSPAGLLPHDPPQASDLDLKFLCTACKNRLRVDARLEGRKISCPVCNERTTVPRWSDTRGLPLEVLELEVKFHCGLCRNKLRADARLAGRGVACPVCSGKIEVPRWTGVNDLSRTAGDNRGNPARRAGGTPPVLLTAEEIDFLSEDATSIPGTPS